MKKWTYHRSHAFKAKDGTVVSMQTQLYKIGIYAILNNNSGMQFSTTPAKMVSLEKRLNKSAADGDITELIYGPSITVVKDDGLFEEYP